jgi:hypothetical protein
VITIFHSQKSALIDPTIAYPPADEEARVYLLPKDSDTSDDLVGRYLSFLKAMFDVAGPVVGGWGLHTHSEIAKRWHDHLAEGQTFQKTGGNRRMFYRDVIKMAKVFALTTALLR